MSSLDFLHGVEVVEIDDGTRPIQTAKSSIIGIVGTAGKGPVNVPTLVAGNQREGVAKFGVFSGDGFTIPEALDGIFDQIGAMCVLVNVCDPTRHNSDIVGEVVTFDQYAKALTAKPYITDLVIDDDVTAPVLIKAGVATLPLTTTPVSVTTAAGVALVADTDYTWDATAHTITKKTGSTKFPADLQKLTVAYKATLTEGVDYTYNPDTGAISRVLGGKLLDRSSVTVAYTYVDPSKVTEADVVGGVGDDQNYKGVNALRASENLLDVVPRILIAPHFTHQKDDAVTANGVVAELLAVAQQIRAVIFADGPNTTDEEAVQYRGDWGSDRIMVVDPWHVVEKPDPRHSGLVPASVHWAGITAKTDNDIGFWASPSNKEIAGIIGTARHVDFVLGNKNCRANYLNSKEVSTTIRKKGFRTWGNRSTSADPKYAFLCIRRTADMVIESIMAAHLWAVDRVINKNYLQEVVEGVNAYMRHLRAVGAIYGGKAWADRTLNTDEVVANGQVYIDFDFTAPYPAEHVTFRAHLVNDYIEEIFIGLDPAA